MQQLLKDSKEKFVKKKQINKNYDILETTHLRPFSRAICFWYIKPEATKAFSLFTTRWLGAVPMLLRTRIKGIWPDIVFW
jgi:signal transduction protein with GAF and PtsI domain